MKRLISLSRRRNKGNILATRQKCELPFLYLVKKKKKKGKKTNKDRYKYQRIIFQQAPIHINRRIVVTFSSKEFQGERVKCVNFQNGNRIIKEEHFA